MDCIEIKCCDGSSLKIQIKDKLCEQRSEYQEILIIDTEQFGKCLIIDDVIQCSESDHELYDKAILQKLTASDRRLLILGGGDGYIAEMALKLNPFIEGITVVDLDAVVIDACKKHLGQSIFDNKKINLVIEDVFHFMPKEPPGSYDGLVCDLTDFPVGYDNSKLCEFFTKVFSLSKTMLKSKGWVGVYAGSKLLCLDKGEYVVDIMGNLLSENFGRIERMESVIPCFAEPCYFLYGENT